MSDIKLYRMALGGVTELSGGAVALEKSLQTLFEANLESLLGVRFLASEFITNEGGRMDSLGIDENNSPVVIEYKRSSNENVINQGLFYLDWLMGHRKDFEWLVLEKLGKDALVTASSLDRASRAPAEDARREKAKRRRQERNQRGETGWVARERVHDED